MEGWKIDNRQQKGSAHCSKDSKYPLEKKEGRKEEGRRRRKKKGEGRRRKKGRKKEKREGKSKIDNKKAAHTFGIMKAEGFFAFRGGKNGKYTQK